MALIRVEGMPASPLDAAARFYAEVAPRVIQCCEAPDGEVVTLLFAPADHPHRGWREAAVASLARTLAPRRINAMVGDAEADHEAIAATLAFLESSGAMTGQMLPLDSNGAGKVLG